MHQKLKGSNNISISISISIADCCCDLEVKIVSDYLYHVLASLSKQICYIKTIS